MDPRDLARPGLANAPVADAGALVGGTLTPGHRHRDGSMRRGRRRLVVSGSADRTCKIWTLGGGHLLRTISLPAAVCAVAIDACEATLYAGAVDGRVFEVPLNASAAIAEATGSTGVGRSDGRTFGRSGDVGGTHPLGIRARRAPPTANAW